MDAPVGGSALSDKALMEQLQQGETQALGALYQRYGSVVSAFLGRLLPSSLQPEVEDLAQDVFLTLLKTAPRYRECGKLKSWLLGIAARKARNLSRKTWLRRQLFDRFSKDSMAINEGTAHPRVEGTLDLEKLLALLSHNHREVLLLHLGLGLKGEEIAALLDIAPNTAWTRLHRARAALRKLAVERQFKTGGQA